MPRQILPDSGTLGALRRSGHTHQQIAEMYGVTPGAVYQALVQAGLVKERPRYDEFIPWRVKREHLWAVPANMLRLLAREANGETLPKRRKVTLDNWVKQMRENDLVVDYDPDQPPNGASPLYGGFMYRHRKPEDGDGFIRRPAGTGTDGQS